MNQNELYHHGIKGMKWGVRRYQNKDGSFTKDGKNRYLDDSDNKKINGKKIAKGAATTAAVALTAYAIANPNSRKFLMENGSKIAESLKKTATSPKVKDFVKDKGTKAIKSLSDSTARAGKAMTDAALVSIGTIQIAKLSSKLETNENDSEEVRNRNKILLDASTAGIQSFTKAGSQNSKSNSNSKGGNVGKEVSNIVGEPSKKSIDKSSNEWQSLFKDSNGNQRDPDTRSTIKSMASAGYDIEQISKYLDSIKHSLVNTDELYHHTLAGSKYINELFI